MRKTFLTALVFMVAIHVNAQITTSEVKVEQTNNITSIAGSVGIGISLPEHPLHIYGNQNQPLMIERNSTSGVWFDMKNIDGTWSLGTMNNSFRVFDRTTTQYRLTLNSEGNLGLGSTSPYAKLTIEGDGATVGSAAVNLKHNGNGMSIGLGASSNNLHIGNSWNPESGTYLTIEDGTGYVGIGTTNPNYKLHINSTDNQLMRFTSTNGAWLDFESTNASNGSRIWSIGHLGTANKFGIYQRDNTNEYRLIITESGNVGIGDTDPSHKLEVNGTIRASTFSAVTPPWSDFVFENNYNLRSLEEVEGYIIKNRHLPDIPSEEELQESGLNLPEMDAKLLQKIEELTLYLIEQNKEIKSLKNEILELKAGKK